MRDLGRKNLHPERHSKVLEVCKKDLFRKFWDSECLDLSGRRKKVKMFALESEKASLI